jgi:hypothetical protein
MGDSDHNSDTNWIQLEENSREKSRGEGKVATATTVQFILHAPDSLDSTLHSTSPTTLDTPRFGSGLI